MHAKKNILKRAEELSLEDREEAKRPRSPSGPPPPELQRESAWVASVSPEIHGATYPLVNAYNFVTQPLNAISPIDQKFFELIVPIATFLTGTLSGIMLAGNDKDAQMKALEAATRPPAPSSPTPTPSNPIGGPLGGFTPPKLEPTLSPTFGSSFGGTAGTFSPAPAATGSIPIAGGAPVMRNGKLGPPQEEHPVI